MLVRESYDERIQSQLRGFKARSLRDVQGMGVGTPRTRGGEECSWSRCRKILPRTRISHEWK